MTEEINKGDLLAKGWTEGAIKKFLPAPEVEERHAYGRGSYVVYLYSPEAVREAEQNPEVVEYLSRVKARREKRGVRKTLPLLDAIREVSRSAHRWRDAAQAQYQAKNYGLAGHSKRQKERLYGLKERGIAAAFLQGLLQYAGASPQGMAVYDYGQGGKSCFHSCLHPAGVERKLVENHPEILEVEAKPQDHAMADAEFTLCGLPEPPPEFFVRSEPPRKPTELRSAVICYECRKEGHIARECPEREDQEEYADEEEY